VSDKVVKQLKDHVKADSADDYTGLWLVVRHAQDLLPEASDDQIRYVVLRALADLLRHGSIVAGDATLGGKFKPWNLAPDEAIQRISEEWDMLGHSPMRGGEIVDFTTPE
jgi:hypothetical protein